MKTDTGNTENTEGQDTGSATLVELVDHALVAFMGFLGFALIAAAIWVPPITIARLPEGWEDLWYGVPTMISLGVTGFVFVLAGICMVVGAIMVLCGVDPQGTGDEGEEEEEEE